MSRRFRPILVALLVLFSSRLLAEPSLLAPDRLQPGDPLVLWAASPLPLVSGRVELRTDAGRLLVVRPLFERLDLAEGGLFGALIGLPLELAPGNYELRLLGEEGGTAFSISRLLVIEVKDFPKENIPLNAANSALRSESDPQKEAEARALYALYAGNRAEALYADAPFLPPVGAARRSAGFGDRRRYLYTDGGSEASSHLGIDFAVPVGTAVRAPARGRVVFAAPRIVTGLTLVIEHLPGLYSVYMHLSGFEVGVDDVVERGQTIARSGSTGLSTGPHLHWEMRAAGLAVDPDFFVDRAPLDTNAVKAALFPKIEGR